MRSLCLGAILGCLLLCLNTMTQAAALRVVVNQAPPYRIIDPPYYGGYYIELFQLAAARAGLEICFINAPLKRAFQMLETGEADLILGPNRTPEREKFLIFLTAAPFPAEEKVFVIAHLDRVIHNLSDLQGLRIDVLAGAVYHPDIDHSNQLHKHELKSYEQGLQRLVRDRSDVVIMPEAQADWLIQELQLPLYKSSFRLRGSLSYIAWSRVTYDDDKAQKLMVGMQQALASQQGQAIRQHYFHSPLPDTSHSSSTQQTR
jgi:polar amino acid transport system substrate-binding protein